jgi:hypothetical protein
MNDSHAALPLPDFDHLPIGHLPARIAPLDASQLRQLLDYETEHAHRLTVAAAEALDNGAEPSGTVATDFPEVGGGAAAATVSPATTNAPKINPPSHGDPTNPAR